MMESLQQEEGQQSMRNEEIIQASLKKQQVKSGGIGDSSSESEDGDQQQKRANEEENKGIENKMAKNGGPRERLKKHRREVAGKVWIPEMWGQEDFLKDWIDCSAFDASLMPQGLMLARASLIDEGRTRSNKSNNNTLTLRVERSSC